MRIVKTASYKKAEGHYERPDGSWGYRSTKYMDHTAYPESLKKKTDEELRYLIQDAKAALEAMPDNPNAGYYADEVNYAAMELNNRKKQRIASTKVAGDPCWDGYKQVGMKDKDGKEVPNCVPEDSKDMRSEAKSEKDWDPNPWAVCTDSVGREDKDKYERCVQDVKKKQK